MVIFAISKKITNNVINDFLDDFKVECSGNIYLFSNTKIYYVVINTNYKLFKLLNYNSKFIKLNLIMTNFYKINLTVNHIGLVIWFFKKCNYDFVGCYDFCGKLDKNKHGFQLLESILHYYYFRLTKVILQKYKLNKISFKVLEVDI